MSSLIIVDLPAPLAPMHAARVESETRTVTCDDRHAVESECAQADRREVRREVGREVGRLGGRLGRCHLAV